MKKIFSGIALVLFISSLIFFSCRKKTEPQPVAFDYTYPDISFELKDSADFGSTSAGWTYIRVAKIDNRNYIQTLSDKKVNPGDIKSTKLKSCVINFISPADSSFNMFDSVFVKVGGTFVYNSEIFFSAYPDMMVAQLYPISKTGLRSLTLSPIDSSVITQLAVDNDVAFRVKLVSHDYILTPPLSFTAQLSFSVTGMTH